MQVVSQWPLCRWTGYFVRQTLLSAGVDFDLGEGRSKYWNGKDFIQWIATHPRSSTFLQEIGIIIFQNTLKLFSPVGKNAGAHMSRDRDMLTWKGQLVSHWWGHVFHGQNYTYTSCFWPFPPTPVHFRLAYSESENSGALSCWNPFHFPCKTLLCLSSFWSREMCESLHLLMSPHSLCYLPSWTKGCQA